MQQFEIYCDGTQSRGALVVDPRTMAPLRFDTRREARAHRDAIVPDQPSKYLPLRVRPVAAS